MPTDIALTMISSGSNLPGVTVSAIKKKIKKSQLPIDITQDTEINLLLQEELRNGDLLYIVIHFEDLDAVDGEVELIRTGDQDVINAKDGENYIPINNSNLVIDETGECYIDFNFQNYGWDAIGIRIRPKSNTTGNITQITLIHKGRS